MNKLCRSIIMAGMLLIASSSAVWANTSDSFMASASFLLHDDAAPVMTHTAVSQVMPSLGMIPVKGNVSDDSGIQGITLFYCQDVQQDWQFSTITPGHTKSYDFSFSVPMEAGKKHFYYYLAAGDVAGKSVRMPAQGGFYDVVIDSASVSVVSDNGGVVAIADAAGVMSIEIPAGAVNHPTNITMTRLDPNETSVPQGSFAVDPVSVYSFGPEGLRFDKPVTLTIPYIDDNNDGIVDGTSLRAQDLKIMWWDGFDWVLVGGTVDSSRKVVTCQIQHFSMYALFAPALTDNDYRPREKIITPATADGVNDTADFHGLTSGDTVSIYDVRGRRVRQLQGMGSGTITPWDGRDDDGSMVESGIYIYQIKVAGKTLSGTIIVAK